MTTRSTTSLRSSIDRSESKSQEKFVTERVNDVEKNFGLLCSEFVAYTRRTAKLRDNGDQICRLLLAHSQEEKFNTTTQIALKQFVEHLAATEDYRDSKVSRLKDKVLVPLSNYGEDCKHVRSNLKTAFTARKKEEDQLKKLDREKAKAGSDPTRLTRARSDLERATLDATKTARDLEEEIVSFELKKLRGLKAILRDYCQIELLWHAKALEMYSKAYNDLQMVDTDEDLEEFRSSLRPESVDNRLSRHRHGGSQGSLQSTGSLGRGTMNSTGRSKPPMPPTKAVSTTGGSNVNNRNFRPASAVERRVQIQDSSGGSGDDDEEEEEEEEEEEDDEVSDDESDYDTTTATTPGRPAKAIINGRRQLKR